MKELIWVGSSKKDLKGFPREVIRRFGQALHFAQEGVKHPHAKPFRGLSGGVFEIVEEFKTDAFRVLYVVQIEDKIYVLHVLHAFQKKSKTGIKTPKNEIEIIKKRLKIAKESK